MSVLSGPSPSLLPPPDIDTKTAARHKIFELRTACQIKWGVAHVRGDNNEDYWSIPQVLRRRHLKYPPLQTPAALFILLAHSTLTA